VTIPKVTQAAVDDSGHFTAPWRNWLSAIERAVSTTTGNTSDTAAAISAIATALGSPDGSVESIPDQDAASFVIISPDNTVAVTGTPASGAVMLALRQVEDSGVGAALYKITRDAYGRVAGTQAASAVDLPYSHTTSGLAATNTQAAIDEIAGNGGFVPYFVPTGTSFYVPSNKQALFALPIELEGTATLVLDGALIEVD
jgi:hypothetical protein